MSDDAQIPGVDFHCHLDLYPDHAAAVARAEAARVYTLAVTTTPKAWPRNLELTSAARYVRAALGLHPQLVGDRPNELPIWERYLSEARYIGEVGLDAGPRYYSSFDTQKRIFRTVLERCAEAGGKILSVHSVRSAAAVLDMLESYYAMDRGAVVLHWFTGSRAEARRAADLGCYFSVNMEMTRSDRGRSLVAHLPLDRILTETDGPFTQVSGRPAEPTDVVLAVEAIARTRDALPESIAKAVKANLRTLLR